MFTKDTFIEIINALREQYVLDVSYSVLLEKLLNADTVPSYDNSKLVNLLITMLQVQFPPMDGICEIERYCYELDFGYTDGFQVISASDLWEQLQTNKVVVMDK